MNDCWLGLSVKAPGTGVPNCCELLRCPIEALCAPLSLGGVSPAPVAMWPSIPNSSAPYRLPKFMLARSKLNNAGSLGSKKAPNEFCAALEPGPMSLDGCDIVGIAEDADMLNVGEAGVAVKGPGFMEAVSVSTWLGVGFVSNAGLVL